LPGVHDVEHEDMSDNLAENNNMSQEYPTGQEDGMQWRAAVFSPHGNQCRFGHARMTEGE